MCEMMDAMIGKNDDADVFALGRQAKRAPRAQPLSWAGIEGAWQMTETFGYSSKSLPAKLGVKPGQRLLAIDAPVHYSRLVAPLPEGAFLLFGSWGRPRPERTWSMPSFPIETRLRRASPILFACRRRAT
jgi:hypothetical protein